MERFPFLAVATITAVISASAVWAGDVLFKSSYETAVDPNGNPDVKLIILGQLNDDDGTPGLTAGDSVSYTYKVTNTGDLRLNSVRLTALTSGVSVSNTNLSSLTPGSEKTRTGRYVLKQSDIDKGEFTNTMSVSADCSYRCPVTKTASNKRTFNLRPNVRLVQSGTLNDDDGVSGVSAGDTISYTFTATNTGNVSLSQVEMSGLGGGVSVNNSGFGNLAPGESKSREGSYSINQSNIDGGSYTSSATVSAACSSDCQVTDDDSDTRTLIRSPGLRLVKTGVLNDDDGTPGLSVGDTISYTFKATNTGNVTLNGVILEEQVQGVSVSNSNLASISPGATRTRTGSYTLKQADISSGSFRNTASVTGQCASGCPVSDSDSDTRTFNNNADISLVLTGSLNDDDGTPGVSAGDSIDYQVSVENTGNLTLSSVSLVDNIEGFEFPQPGLGTMPPGASLSRIGTYILNQSDVDAGGISNQVSVTAACSSGCPASDEDSDYQALERNPSIRIVKTGSLNDDDGTPGVTAGDSISYSFRVTNTGNVSLSAVTLSDENNDVSLSGTNLSGIAPGASKTRTGSYTLSQGDIDSGRFTNTASARANCGTGCQVADDDSDTRNFSSSASLDVDITGEVKDVDGTVGLSAGDRIDYSFSITNTGTVTLQNVNLDDHTAAVVLYGNPISSLAPGASNTNTFSGRYTLTQADIDQGSYFYSATASADCTASGCPVEDEDFDSRTLNRSPSVALNINAQLNDNDGTPGVSAGDRIQYQYEIQNTGNVTLANVSLDNPSNGVNPTGNAITEMAPGQQNISAYSAQYILTQSDVDSGVFQHSARVTGQCVAPACPSISTDLSSVTLDRNANILLTVTGDYEDTDGTPGASAGDKISYSFTITNTGNVTLSQVQLAQQVAGVSQSGSSISSLAPGQSNYNAFSAERVVTQGDVNAGSFYNSAIASAQCAASSCPVSDQDSDTQTLDVSPLYCATFFADSDDDDYGENGSDTELCSYNPQGPPLPSSMALVDGDCDDSDAQVNPGQSETAPSNNLKDENCDGVDGNVDLAILVSRADGSDTSSCGTLNLPCRSIEQGIDRAVQLGRQQIYIQEGVYTESVQLSRDLDLYGGYGNNTWTRSFLLTSEIVGEWAYPSGHAVRVDYSEVYLNNLTLTGPDVIGVSTDANSYVLYSPAGGDITLERVTLSQGRGRDGTDGTNGSSASQSQAPSGQSGGAAQGSSEFCDLSRSSGGGASQNPSCPSLTSGGTGGLGGKMNTRIEVKWADVCIDEALDGAIGGHANVQLSGVYGSGGAPGEGLMACTAGQDGESGRVFDGSAGTGGTGGEIQYDIWRTEAGGNGSKGFNGGGGGGGGGAGGCDTAPEARGGAGGAGGTGGCRADEYGTGGVGGGGSFGVYIKDGDLTVRSSTFERGTGGSGGDGGDGGSGQPGGSGGSGGTGYSGAGAGGDGGNGGRGGHSGGGGGGGGGPSCGIIAINSTVDRTSNNSYTGGTGGGGGNGGGGPIPGQDGQNGALCEMIQG